MQRLRKAAVQESEAIMTSGMFKYVVAVLAFFLLSTVAMSTLPNSKNERELKQYTVCVQAGGSYDGRTNSCDMP